jgi:hypothetical protein
MKPRSLSVILVGVAIFTACLVSTKTTRAAGSTYLYWSDPHVTTGSTSHCYSFAKQTMSWKQARGVRVIPIEVSGTIGSTYAAITCIGTSPNVTAMVMVVGPNQNETIQVRDALANHIKGIRILDDNN